MHMTTTKRPGLYDWSKRAPSPPVCAGGASTPGVVPYDVPEVAAAPVLDDRTRVLREYLGETGSPDLALIVGPDVFADVVGELSQAALYRHWPEKNAWHRWQALMVVLDGLKNLCEEARPYHLESTEALEALVRRAFVSYEVLASAQFGRETKARLEENGRRSADARADRAGTKGWKLKAHQTHAALVANDPGLSSKERAERCRLALRGLVQYRTVYDEITTPQARARYPEVYGQPPGWNGKL
jgi:hypothetical protein